MGDVIQVIPGGLAGILVGVAILCLWFALNGWR